MNKNLSNILKIFIIIAISLVGCSPKAINREAISLAGTTMGTTYSIKIIVDEDEKLIDNINAKIDSILIEVNNQMSTYQKDSELSLFNKNLDTSWMPVSKDFVEVMEKSIEISNQTSGAFDITIGPLVNLWGFGPTDKINFIPSKDEIEEIKKNTGFQYVITDKKTSQIKKNNPKIYCDLSGIAKGFGVDKVAIFIQSCGYDDYMVEIGGEVRTNGLNKSNKEWRIGISSPTNNNLQEIIGISNLSMATSGDYLNYFEKNGIRYSHTIDPKTGKPIVHKLASVTVIHEECKYADGVATAINVMGPELGYQFAVDMKLPIFMIVREGDGFIDKISPEFKKYIIKDKK